MTLAICQDMLYVVIFNIIKGGLTKHRAIVKISLVVNMHPYLAICKHI